MQAQGPSGLGAPRPRPLPPDYTSQTPSPPPHSPPHSPPTKENPSAAPDLAASHLPVPTHLWSGPVPRDPQAQPHQARQLWVSANPVPATSCSPRNPSSRSLPAHLMGEMESPLETQS